MTQKNPLGKYKISIPEAVSAGWQYINDDDDDDEGNLITCRIHS